MREIEIVKVGYEYAGAAGAVTALRDVSFDVGASEFLCLVGRSGCGKTTLLNLVAGFLPPTRGEIRIGGHTVTGHGLDRGVVFQDFAQLFPWRTAQRNVEFGLEMRGVSAAERAATALRFLKLVDLERFTREASRTTARCSVGSSWRQPSTRKGLHHDTRPSHPDRRGDPDLAVPLRS